MARGTKVTIYKGGTKEFTKPISQIEIPDLWPIAEAIRGKGEIADRPGCADLILECWSRAHAFKQHILES